MAFSFSDRVIKITFLNIGRAYTKHIQRNSLLIKQRIYGLIKPTKQASFSLESSEVQSLTWNHFLTHRNSLSVSLSKIAGEYL